VIENLQEELHISNRAFGMAERQQKEAQATVDHLQVETFVHSHITSVLGTIRIQWCITTSMQPP